jgi:S-formylglutathione hydrolase FrmB
MRLVRGWSVRCVRGFEESKPQGLRPRSSRASLARLKPCPCRYSIRPFAIAFLVVFAQLALAQGRIDCSTVDSRILKKPVHYCVQVPGHYDQKDAQGRLRRFPVLYYLHGLGDDEQSFSRSGGWTLIEDLREHGRIGDFLIVAPRGFASFYVNSADGKLRYSDFFVREFTPYIEKKYRVMPGREGRAVTGISMGGYGGLRFAFAYPEMFSAVSAQSAALMLISPDDLNAAAESRMPVMNALGGVFGNPIDVGHWRANDPFVLAKKNRAALKGMAIYFNCGQSDDYGFEKGAAALDQQLTKEGIAHEYRPYPGRHSINYFLSHLEEVMEFHSRAFDRNASSVVGPRSSANTVVSRQSLVVGKGQRDREPWNPTFAQRTRKHGAPSFYFRPFPKIQFVTSKF